MADIKQPFLPLDSRFSAANAGLPVPRQLPLALGLAAPFSIDNFIVSSANRAAFEMLESWPHWPGPVTVLAGAPSSGKSHLASVWAAQAYAAQCDPQSLNKAVETAARGIPVLLEDVDKCRFDETHLFHLINTVRETRAAGAPAALLMTAERRPAGWGVRLADLASRLKAVNLAEIGAPDDELRYAVLAKLFADRQLAVETEILRFILYRSERSLRRLAQIVARIDALALERRSKITRALAAEALAERAENAEQSNGQGL